MAIDKSVTPQETMEKVRELKQDVKDCIEIVEDPDEKKSCQRTLKCIELCEQLWEENQKKEKRIKRMEEALQTARNGFDEVEEYEMESTGQNIVCASHKALITPTFSDPF